MADRDFIQETARQLAAEQDRVQNRAGQLGDDAWDLTPGELVIEQLVGHEHFAEYAAELDWAPREIVGHLRDSANLHTERVLQMRAGDEPEFAQFDTTADDRIADYRDTEPDRLVEQLQTAQTRLREVVRSVEPDELDHTATLEGEGEITLREVLEFLPRHQRNHADHLEALTASAMTGG